MIVSAIVLFFFSGTTSPLYNILYSDGRVYQYMAMGIAEGKIPYVDIFDNKGPFLYFINYIAFIIDQEYGLLFLQWLHLVLFFFLCHRLLVLLHANHFYNWIFPLFLSFFIRYYDDGNLTEEWSLILLTLPLFYILPLYLGEKNELSRTQSFFYGFCVGLITLLRLNNVVPLLGVLLWWLVDLIRLKQYTSLACFLLFSVFGFILPIITAAGWFYLNAGIYGVNEWVYATIIVNFAVFKSQVLQTSEIPLWKILPAVFFHVVFICICLIKTCKTKQISLVISLVLTFVLTYSSIGQSWYPHYQMVLVPTYLIAFALLSQTHRSLLLSIILLTSLYMCKYNVSIEWSHYHENGRNASFQKEFAQVVDYVPIDERNQLWNLNASIYNYIDVAYQQKLFPMNRIDRPNLDHDKYPQSSFVDQCPLWVVVDETELDKETAETHFLWHNYHMIASTHSDFRHNLSIYKRNNGTSSALRPS